MTNCWAASLGGCGGKISREHLVPKCLFLTDKITVQGFPWCLDKPKEIGLANLTAKILCEKHNNALSPTDTSAGQSFDTFRQMTHLSNTRSAMRPRIWTVKRYKIDGKQLERWCLKTLINIACERKYPIGRDSDTSGRPSDRLVQITFGRKAFENRAGLYSVVRVGMEVKLEDRVQVLPLDRNGRVEGGLFTFRGFTFLLFLESDGPPQPITGLVMNGEDIGNAQLLLHNKEFKCTLGRYLSQSVKIIW